MGAGLFLVVIGAILTFAVKDDLDHLNLPVTGIILMIAGVVLMVHARTTPDAERTVTLREESSDPDEATHTVEETVRENRTD